MMQTIGTPLRIFPRPHALAKPKFQQQRGTL
jgi:hypothetical protein